MFYKVYRILERNLRRLKFKIEIVLLSKIRNKEIDKEISIISNNCWGGFISKRYNLKYNSPFVGLYLFAKDYILLLENLKENLEYEIEFIEIQDSKYKKNILKYELKPYPIGIIRLPKDNIEIHFLHYKSKKEALSSWNKRTKRINYENMIVKFSDGDLCNEKLIIKFDGLNYKNKVCFTAKDYPKLKSVIQIKEFKQQEKVVFEWLYSEKYIKLSKILF